MSVFPLAGVAEYQSGAVVSRVLLKKTGGTVTAFAFDAGEGLSEHTTPYEALAFVSEGEAVITIGGTPHTVRAGELLALPAGIPHAVAAVNRFKMLLVMIKGD